jgi:hypothetical protein
LRKLRTIFNIFFFDILDKILNDLGSVIKVENNSSKGFLLKNTEKFQNSSHHENSDKGGSGGINVFKLFRFGGSAKIVQENSNEWEETGKSLNEQVMEFKIYIIFWLKLIFSQFFYSKGDFTGLTHSDQTK